MKYNNRMGVLKWLILIIYFSWHRDVLYNSGPSGQISATNLLKTVIDDKRRDSIIAEVLICLTNQLWLSGKLKEDLIAQPNNPVWGFGTIHIFNIRPIISSTTPTYPAAIIDWKIFDYRWWDKSVRSILTYTNEQGTVNVKWTGV